MCKKIPPRIQKSSKGLEEMGYIPPAFLASEEFVGGIFPLKIPPTLKYSTNWRNFVCGGKKFHQKIPLKIFPILNINSLSRFTDGIYATVCNTMLSCICVLGR
jgi:hypothetical protein